jgi:glyoxylase-like metal-dependent hydrolase (beta-lactamase superfamily II)
LCDPAKLWQSALEVLGDIAEMYGAPLPLPPESILNHELPGITILETPGHAPHHLTFFVPLHDEKLVFVGESAGLFLPLASSPTWPYLRPTTPPKFDAAAARNSLDKIAAALQGDELLCYGHWGAARRSQIQIGFAKEQLEEWLSIVSRTRHKSVEEIADYLLLNDTFLGKYADLPGDLREREFFFIANSVKGILEYLQDSAK